MEALKAMEVVKERVKRAYDINKAPLETSRAWCEIDLPNLRSNVQALEQILPERCTFMAAVKANAYGHGAVEVAKELNRAGIRDFAVASLEEAISLRQNGVKGDILILGYTYPLNVQKLVYYNLIQTVVDREYAETLDSSGLPVRVHVKIDTGMHRLGVSYDDLEGLKVIYGSKNLKIEGTYSHLSVSDSLEEDDVEFSREQIRRFYQVIAEMKEWGVNPGKIHIQSSYGVLNFPELQFDYARIGIALYGVLSGLHEQTRIPSFFLKPVFTLRSRISTVRDLQEGETVGYGRSFKTESMRRIAVVSIGYADGIPRNFSNGVGQAMVRGKKVPVVGRVCMDQLMIDVTDIEDVTAGEIVTFIGQEGKNQITAEEVAEAGGTITNEFLSRIGCRVNRVYIR